MSIYAQQTPFYPFQAIPGHCSFYLGEEVLLKAMESLHLIVPLQNLLIEFPMHLPKWLLQSILNLIDLLLYAQTKVGGLFALHNRECGVTLGVDCGPILALLFEFLLALRVGVAE